MDSRIVSTCPESLDSSVSVVIDNMIGNVEAIGDTIIGCQLDEGSTVAGEIRTRSQKHAQARTLDQPNEENNDDYRCDQDESVEYIVKDILDKKTDKHGVTKYLVSWEGYSKDECTWEPVQNLLDCDRAMHKFELMRADRLARKYWRSTNSKQAGGSDKPSNNNSDKEKHKEYKVVSVRGITIVNDVKYFLIELAETKEPAFIRASLAKQLFPSKVIDFYMQHLKIRP